MGVELATAYVSIVPDTKGLGRTLVRDMRGQSAIAGKQSGGAFASGFGRAMGGVAKMAAAATFAVAGLGAAGFGFAVKQGIEFNDMMEQSKVGFTVLLKSSKKADKAIRDLFEYSSKTPFEFPEVAAAGRMFATVGLDIEKTVKWVGDLAAVAPASAGGIEEVARAISRLASGDFGESFERLRDFGISKPMLEGEGLKFDKSGQYKGSIEEALAAVERIVKSRFGGMAAAQSKTFSGMLSTLKDNANQVFGEATKPLFDWMKGQLPAVGKMIGDIGGILKEYGVTAEGVGRIVERVFGKDAADTFGNLIGTFSPLVDLIRGVDWKAVAADVSAFISGFRDGGAVQGVADAVRSLSEATGALTDAFGGWEVIGFLVSGTLFRLGQMAKFAAGAVEFLIGRLTFDTDKQQRGAKMMGDALRDFVTGPAREAGSAFGTAKTKLDAFNDTPVGAKTVKNNFGTVASHANTMTGKVRIWNATPAGVKSVKTNFQTVASHISSALQRLIAWNHQPVKDKQAFITFTSVKRSSDGGTVAPGHATGGYFTKPSVITIGDGNQQPGEWAISTDPRYRAQNLAYLAQANKALGGSGGDITIPISLTLDGRVVDERIVRVTSEQVRRGRSTGRVSFGY